MLDTDELVYDVNKQTCHNLGAFLPEPRNERENKFLDSLGANTFLLGLTDQVSEGQWIWYTDGSTVTWESWITWADDSPREPNGVLEENCMVMARNWLSDKAGHRSEGWIDTACLSHENYRNMPTSLVCQRNPGEFGNCALGKIVFLKYFVGRHGDITKFAFCPSRLNGIEG